MLFQRIILPRIEARLFLGKAVIIYGARRVGKTTLVRQILHKIPDGLYLSGDEPDVRQAITNKTSTELKHFIGNKKIIVIDEAQRIPNIGLTLKLLVDTMPETQVIATGSSSFDLSNKINEPLTGRAWEFFLPPLAVMEISTDPMETDRLLETRMIYGLYPEIVTVPETARETIGGIYKNYLYKDALEFQALRRPELIEKLLVALALQLGNEVSLTELATLLEADKKTIATYIRLLELAFVVFRLPPFARNLRNEINASRKICFWDNGIRNAIINNFNPLSLRADTGALWENFAIAERMKRNANLGLTPNVYFWRTWSKQEIDYIEEEGGQLHAFEMKWQKVRARPPALWKKTYENATWQPVTRGNYLDFVSAPS